MPYCRLSIEFKQRTLLELRSEAGRRRKDVGVDPGAGGLGLRKELYFEYVHHLTHPSAIESRIN
jgi:hypothetical protein